MGVRVLAGGTGKRRACMSGLNVDMPGRAAQGPMVTPVGESVTFPGRRALSRKGRIVNRIHRPGKNLHQRAGSGLLQPLTSCTGVARLRRYTSEFNN